MSLKSQQKAEMVPVDLESSQDVLHHPQFSLGLTVFLKRLSVNDWWQYASPDPVSAQVFMNYLWHSKVTDVLKVWADNWQFTLHSLILTPHPLHFLNKKHHRYPTHVPQTSLMSTFTFFPIQNTPATHHTFWPWWWPVPPGAKLSGPALLPGP